RVVAIDPSTERLGLARAVGAFETLDPSAGDVGAAIRDMTHGDGADAPLDCSGNSGARANCAKAARAWGRACVVGAHGTATFDMTPDVIHKQLTMIGSWTFNAALMAECAQFAVDRHVTLGDVFTHEFTLDQAEEAYHLTESQTVGKGVFLFDA